MSARNSTSRRPSTANATSDKTSFLAPENEVLLWAKQLQRQHGELLLRMNKLQDQQETFDSRIQSTESIAKTITSETFKIDDIDRRVTALATGDQEFEDWVGGAIKRLERNVEANAKLQKVVTELETRYSGMRSEIEKVTSNQRFIISEVEQVKVALRELQQQSAREGRAIDTDVMGLLRRVEKMESQIMNKDREMGGLKEGIVNLERNLRQQNEAGGKPHAAVTLSNGAHQQRSASVVSEATTTSEPAPLDIFSVQVPRTPQRKERLALGARPLNPVPKQKRPNARQKVSARMRLIQQPSILDAKEHRIQTEKRIPVHDSQQDLRDCEDAIGPDLGTQTSKPGLNKRRRIDTQTQRQTRSQAKAVAAEEKLKVDTTDSKNGPAHQAPFQSVNQHQGLLSSSSHPQKKQESYVVILKTRGSNAAEKSSHDRIPKNPASLVTKPPIAVSSTLTSNNVPPKRKRKPLRRVIPDYPGL